MTSTYDRVKQFHHVFGVDSRETPGFPSSSIIELRLSLIHEELNELLEAVNTRNTVGVADALADLDYVINGMALAFGIDLPACGVEVHRSNMSKAGPDGKPILREDGKILKGPDYSPPDLWKVLGIDRPKVFFAPIMSDDKDYEATDENNNVVAALRCPDRSKTKKMWLWRRYPGTEQNPICFDDKQKATEFAMKDLAKTHTLVLKRK